MWEEPMMIPTVFPPEVVKDKNSSELKIETKNGSFIYLFGADRPDMLRGPNPRGVVLDECEVLKEDVWTKVLAPIIYSNGGWAWFTGTPNGLNWFHRLYFDALQKPDEWEVSYLPVTESHLLSDELIEKIKQSLPASAFDQEYLCKWVDGGRAFFRKIDEAIKGELIPPQSGIDYVFGIDLGRKQDYTVISGFNRQTNHLDFFDRFNTIDWDFQVKRIEESASRYNKAVCVVESNSMGDPIIGDLLSRGINVIPFKTTASSKKEIIEKLSLFIEQKYITFPKIEDILNELNGFGYEITAAGNVKFGAPNGLHDDCVMSMAFAVSQLRKEVLPKILPAAKLWDFDTQEDNRETLLDPYL